MSNKEPTRIKHFPGARVEHYLKTHGKLPKEETKTCPRCQEPWDEAGGCQDPECPCDKS